ncbi:3125_t:CDS:2 [Dentiscutata heterogama]|uniref:3125_t:CDS:1 n=1 Tax=Dentiscutata heterogama TaxID=1316150 RepID=A0ACA9M0Z9_9GLOM|nr:3125_t:CDS:2 [Dentiscutata heterogama]
MTTKRGGGLLRINKAQGRGGGKALNPSGGPNANQSGAFTTSSSPKPHNNISSEELIKRTARANRFRDTLDPDQLSRVGRVPFHGQNSKIKNEGPPINPVDDFFEVLSIYHQTQMMIKQVNDTLPSVRKKLAWDFFHEMPPPITLSTLYEKGEADKEIENENNILEAKPKPKSLDLSPAQNFLDVEMEDVVQFIKSPVTSGSMDVDEAFPYMPPFTQIPSLSNSPTINQKDQSIFGQIMASPFQRRLSDLTRKNSLERMNSIILTTEKSNSTLSMDVDDNYSNQDKSFIEQNDTLVGSPIDEEEFKQIKQIEETATETIDEPDVTSDTDPPIVDEQENELESPDLPTPKLDLYSLVHGPPQLTQTQLLKEDKIKQRQALYKKTKALPDRITSEKKRRKNGYDKLINKNRNVQCVLARIDDQKAKATKKAQEEVESRRKVIEAHDEDYESAKKEIRRRNQILERVTNECLERAKKDPKYKYSMTKIQEEALIEIENTPSLLRS